MGSDDNPKFENLLDYLRRARGFDFTGYKRPSLVRRVNKRMQAVGIEDYSDYVDYLEVHPEEFSHLFNTLLINVTAFFRDRPTWDYLSQAVIPRIVAYKQPGDLIRVWCAGCASGEEAYTLAIALAETIGSELFAERVKIYATDIDEEALNQARQAIYSAHQLEGMPPELVEKYFEPLENTYVFRKDLRRAVIFGCHDLIQDAPISKVDLLVCRNTIMYFNAETQARIVTRFHFALKDSGFLLLGKAEMLQSHSNSFVPIDLKNRVFKKVSRLNLRERFSFAGSTLIGGSNSSAADHELLREATFDTEVMARLVVGVDGSLVLANERARALFNVSVNDLGRPLQDLDLFCRPVELRALIEQAYREQRIVYIYDVEYLSPQGGILHLEVQATPLFDRAGNPLGIGITFTDVSHYQRLQTELEHSNQELEMAYEELQSTNEELETTNEELQSTNEELETTNEELQSTNEELETMNEELQSTNEELQTVNNEFQRRSAELDETNAFLKSILASLKGGVVVLDRNLCMLAWNYKAEDLWGLRGEEMLGQNFLNLHSDLPVDQLRQTIRDCLSSQLASEIELDAAYGPGQSVQTKITCTPLVNSDQEVRGVILLIEESGAKAS